MRLYMNFSCLLLLGGSIDVVLKSKLTVESVGRPLHLLALGRLIHDRCRCRVVTNDRDTSSCVVYIPYQRHLINV